MPHFDDACQYRMPVFTNGRSLLAFFKMSCMTPASSIESQKNNITGRVLNLARNAFSELRKLTCSTKNKDNWKSKSTLWTVSFLR